VSELPKVPSKWVHYKGAEYEVYDLLNTDADPGREVDHPVIVCYRGANGKKWGKTLDVFLNTMKPKESAWEARKQRIRSLQNQPDDKEAVIPVGRATLVPRELINGAFSSTETVEYLVPEIKLWSPSQPGAIGAFAYIQLTPSSNETATNEDKLQFIRELWENGTDPSNPRSALRDTARYVAGRWAEKLQLGYCNEVARERIRNSPVAFIGLYQGQPIVSRWCTSFGGDLVELTTFLSILRHVSLKYAGDVYDERHLHMIAGDFNRLVRTSVAMGAIHPRNEPAAVVDNRHLRFLLPRDIKGDRDAEPQYAETEFVGNTLRILFDPEVTALIVNIFGGDCLNRVLL